MGTDPVAEDSRRSIAEVTELAVIAAEVDYASAPPGAVTFGAERSGSLELLLRFEPVWRDSGNIEQAFLLLEPLPHGAASAASVDVEVFRIDQSWSKASVTWLDQPALAHPKAKGIANSNGSPLRVEVTRLVKYLRQHPRQDHGIALRAAAGGAAGVSYATGVAGGNAPRIEIYTR
jgi:hypothetical protein